MLVLRDTASMRSALEQPIDADLRDLIARRMKQLGEHVDGDLGQLAHFIVVEPGDHLTTIDQEVGFSLLHNLVDGRELDDPEFAPSFEWIQDHGGWFELVYILTDDGFGTIIFVQDHPGIEFDVHMLCLEYAGRP